MNHFKGNIKAHLTPSHAVFFFQSQRRYHQDQSITIVGCEVKIQVRWESEG